MAFKTDERYKISKCYDHELLQLLGVFLFLRQFIWR